MKKVGEVVLFGSDGKISQRFPVERKDGKSDSDCLNEMMDKAEELYQFEISSGGRLWLYNSKGDLIQEVN
jgi:hypothetical protein